MLDEVDQLSSRRQEILYRIFQWPLLSSSRLILIGVANALDLTDRMLPWLQGCVAAQPQLLHFKSYSKDQILDILCARLDQVHTVACIKQVVCMAVSSQMKIQFFYL